MKIVCDEWESLVKAIRLNGASEVQRKEMKRVFFGGFASAMGVFTGIEDGKEEEAFASIHKELNEFTESVIRGES